MIFHLKRILRLKRCGITIEKLIEIIVKFRAEKTCAHFFFH